MDILQLYQDYSVDHLTEGHKHCRPGWVNTPCPFCTGNPGYHLSYHLANDFFLCWRCGWHPTELAVSKLLNIPFKEAERLVKQYGGTISIQKAPEPKITKEHRMPSGVEPLNALHKKYLESRNYDADRLERTWNLVGTGPVSRLDLIDFKFRIIIPILWNNLAVSFTSRDITGKHSLRYISCPQDREIINHKTILYGRQEHWGKTGICVEGPTDAWRLGVHSFATYGIKYTPSQVREMARAFKRIPVIYDDDPQAIVQANLLVADLKFRGVDSFRVAIKGDPGGMSQLEADYMVKQLIN